MIHAADQAVVTSGVYERGFVLDGVCYHHILDTKTGWPVQNGLVSVTIIADNSTLADALSTACFALGKEAGLALAKANNAQAVFVEESGQVTCSEGLEGSGVFEVLPMKTLFGNRREIDMCKGPLVREMVRYAIPIAITGVLQLLYNAIDMVVVGRYVGSQSLAAVGATNSVLKLVIYFMMGLSVGLNVVIAQHCGAREDKEANEALHSCMYAGFMLSLFLGGALFALTKIILVQMGTPPDVIKGAILYMRIYSLGAPAILLYNFGAAALRAIGDTQRPLKILALTGLLHVLLNLLFVLKFNMDVAGVAWATTISQYVSAFMVMACLTRMNGNLHFSLQGLKINRIELMRAVGVGLPSAIQSSMFAIANVIIQSAVNSFGSVVMAAMAAASNVDGFMCIAITSISQTGTAFAGQNVGASNYDRVKKITRATLLMTLGTMVFLSIVGYLFREPIIGIYVTEREVIYWGAQIFAVYCMGYFIFGMEQSLVGTIRGTGYTILSMTASVFGACIPRILWVYLVCTRYDSVLALALVYPVSWLTTLLLQTISYTIAMRKVKSDIASRLRLAYTSK